MSDKQRVVIIGGHGKVALLAAHRLSEAGYDVNSIVRNPDQSDDVQAAGGNPVVLDIQAASTEGMAKVFSGAAAIVFSAGAGGNSTPERTRAIDHDAATRAMAAAGQASVDRFIMVSYANAATDVDRLDPKHAFYPYAKAKHDADAHLRNTDLDYTILGPAMLTTEPATGKIQLTEQAGDNWPDDKRVTSRDNVAEMITHVIATNAAVRQTVNFYDGEIPMADALNQRTTGA